MISTVFFRNFLTTVSILMVLYLTFGIIESWANWKEVKIFHVTGFTLKGLIYLSIYCSVIISIFVLAFNSSRVIAIISLMFLFVNITIDYSYKKLNGQGFTYEDSLLVFQNIGFSLEKEILSTFLPTIMSSCLIATFVLFLIIGFRYIFNSIRIQKKRFLLLPIIVFITVNYIIYLSNANRLAFPAFYKIPSILIYSSQKDLYSGERDEVYIKSQSESIANHIVWIVDESVRADQLQINGLNRQTTPFLESKKDSLFNYGIASSGAVCSDYSHIMLMSGLQFQELPDKNSFSRRYPTIFQYAKESGMKSNLLYAPGNQDVPKGYMTSSDFYHIDYRWHTRKIFPNLKPYEIDLKSIELLEEIVNTQKSSFTYFLKYGCHFHYESTYPFEERYFEPVQDINSWKRNDREKLINSYHNAIRWEVDHFFESLHTRFNGKDILFIYTSDHGQHLMEYPDIELTHCIKNNAPAEMAMVPLFLFTMNSSLFEKIKPFFNEENVNHASHFNIFPTTLMFMGFDPEEVQDRYGASLVDSLSQSNQNFVSGDIFGRSDMYINQLSKKHNN